jgi:hypothetical protein
MANLDVGDNFVKKMGCDKLGSGRFWMGEGRAGNGEGRGRGLLGRLISFCCFLDTQ